MLENWFLPIHKLSRDYEEHTFGGQIEKFTDQMPDLKHIRIALIGADPKAADLIRRELYAFSTPFQGLGVADIGNLRKQDHSFIIPVLEELLAGGVLPVLMGGHLEPALAQYLSYQQRRDPVNVLVVDKVIQCGSEQPEQRGFWDTILFDKKGHLFHAAVLGDQSHLTTEPGRKLWEDWHFDTLRLGKIKSAISDAEPLIRDADLMMFQIGSIKRSEAPGQEDPASSGLTTEEACQICRYAGMSDKLTSVGFFGYMPSKDIRQQTAQVAAQLIWYFIDGFYHRKQDFPVSTAHLMEYIVSFKETEHPLTFWKSNKSGRWWMQIPVKTRRKYQRHRLIPCSYADYEQACNGELPERLIRAMARF